jgi:hypothetical protein
MFSAADCPNTCASGAAPKTTSAEETPRSAPSVVATERRPEWVSSAPFGRAGGVENHRRVAGLDSGDLFVRGRIVRIGRMDVRSGALRSLRRSDEDTCTRILDPVLDLGLLEEEVQRHRNRAEPERTVVGVDELGHVRQQDCDPVAARDAMVAEQRRASRSSHFESRVVEARASRYDRRPVRSVGRRRVKKRCDVRLGSAAHRPPARCRYARRR